MGRGKREGNEKKKKYIAVERKEKMAGGKRK